VRKSITFFWFLFALWALAAAPSVAETIHLKNGRTIWADRVRDTGTHIEYDVGDDTYAIPKSAVDHIESGGVAPVSPASNHAASDLPEFAPNAEPPAIISAEVADKVIQHGTINSDGLNELEQAGNAKLTAAGYYLAGKHEFEAQNYPLSASYFEKAVRFDPENPAILNYYAALLVRTGNAGEAQTYAERAVKLAPNSPDAYAVLGYAQFAGDHNREAIESWKHSVSLRPDAQLTALLAKAEKEAKTESTYSQRDSDHFTLRYEGKQTSDELRQQIMSGLESDYNDLTGQLSTTPHDRISVILYTDQAFFDVTQAPSWTGAVNDGKLRIPVQGVSAVTPELAHVLKHELTHSFINQLAAGRCPQWLNEGVAQAMEPKPLANGHRLEQLFHAQQEIPYNMLEGSFIRFSGGEAVLAYDESLAAVLYISDTYGMGAVQRLLASIGEGTSTEAALRSTIHTDYAHLDQEVSQYLNHKFGD
jgi:tetratricopeptide (TPR) repeat protein